MQTSIAVRVFDDSRTARPERAVHLRDVNAGAANCGGCALRSLCVVAGLTDSELLQLHNFLGARRRIKRGETLWDAGAPLQSLYVVRLGFFKSFLTTTDGQVQVTGFQTSGEILGMDAIATGRHNSTVVALEDTEVCPIPFAALERLMDATPALQRTFLRIMSREIVREQESMALLGTMRAEQRVASFLLRLSSVYQKRGYSDREFVLRMTREELGNYLGLKLETVSRLFSKLQQEGVIAVDNKTVRLLDLCALNVLSSRKALDS